MVINLLIDEIEELDANVEIKKQGNDQFKQFIWQMRGELSDYEYNMWHGNDLIERVFYDPKTINMHKQARDFIIDTVIKNIERTYEVTNVKI